MKYERFEDVPVWQTGIDLTAKTFNLTQERSFQNKGDIANQLQRAALSVPNNIAEGFERGTTAELIMFLYYAKGSAGEVRSICHVIDRMAAFNHLRSEISDLKLLATSVSRQLAAWAQSLQNTDIRGPRHLTAQSKSRYEQKKRADAFMQQLKEDSERRIRELQESRTSAPRETHAGGG